MRTALTALVGTAILLAAIAASSLVLAGTATSSVSADSQLAGPPRELVQYGHIRSLVRKSARYELRFDPAFWLGGTTANRAAAEDGVIQPGEPVPNDYYIRDESKRLLTYRVPAGARVTIVANPSTGLRSIPISVSELAQIVKGRNPRHRPLYGSSLGFWIRITTDTVRSLEQQYQP